MALRRAVRGKGFDLSGRSFLKPSGAPILERTDPERIGV
jgi:hypothetical protein